MHSLMNLNINLFNDEMFLGICQCKHGWRGQRCESICEDGRWGADCSLTCQCDGGPCDPKDGSCSCQPGRQGETCDLCQVGLFGLDCLQDCPLCKNSSKYKIKLQKGHSSFGGGLVISRISKLDLAFLVFFTQS